MKIIVNILEKLKPHFHEGGRAEKLFPLFDATQTFLFRLPVRTTTNCHVRDAYDIKRMMMLVIVSLVPCAIFGIYNVGYQHYLSIGVNANIFDIILYGLVRVVPIYIVTYVTGLFWEILFAVIRKHEINEGFFVTGFLIPLVLPPTIPLWQVAVATTFGVVLGKEVFGGTGMNIFNPALLTRAFIFFAYPQSMSGTKVWIDTGEKVVDTFTMATPLAIAANNNGNIIEFLQVKGYYLFDMVVGLIPGSIGETSLIAILLGAFILIATGVASFRIMISVFAGGFITISLLHFFVKSSNGLINLPPYYHLALGGFAFGAVFMATDPVSSAATKIGKYIYGFLIGALTILVRVYNEAYSEGMMLAIIFMNLFAPLIDYFVVSANIKRRRKLAEK